MLEQIGRSGCRMGIVSSNAEDNIRTCLRANGAEPWFEFVVGYPRLLGKQRGLRRILRKTALQAGMCCTWATKCVTSPPLRTWAWTLPR